MKRFNKKTAKKTDSPTTSSLNHQTSEPHHLPTSTQKIKVNVNATPHTPKPLPPQRSQTLLMQMITLHPEQHICHRKQHQRHKQINPMPSHKRKPHNLQDSILYFHFFVTKLPTSVPFICTGTLPCRCSLSLMPSA